MKRLWKNLKAIYKKQNFLVACYSKLSERPAVDFFNVTIQKHALDFKEHIFYIKKLIT